MLFKVNGHLKIFLELKKPAKDLDEIDFIILPQISTSALLFTIHNAKIDFSGLDKHEEA